MSQDLPGIVGYMDNENPTISSPFSPFIIQFYQTPDSLNNIEDYRVFLKNIESAFRVSREYKAIKARLIESGMSNCQVHGNLNSEMVTIEMHHNMLTLFDLAMIIAEHMVRTTGRVSSFDVERLLVDAHANNEVLLVMLSKTPHQIYHNNSEFFLPFEMCIGEPWKFLEKYKYGITQDIAYKILRYLRQEEKNDGKINDQGLLNIRDTILNWSNMIE